MAGSLLHEDLLGWALRIVLGAQRVAQFGNDVMVLVVEGQGSARNPCLSALQRDVLFPSGVLGPPMPFRSSWPGDSAL